MSAPKTVKLSQASNCGFHFANLYQCCQRKFFIKFVIRPAAKYVSASLLYGVAVHEGCATFYKTKSMDKAKAKVIAELKKVKTLFEHFEEYQTALLRGPILVAHWVVSQGALDLKRYNIISVEGDFSQELPGMPGFVFTGRMDIVVQDKKTLKYYVIDHKTSSSSKDLTENGVKYGDQATGYIWLASKQLNVKIEGMIADILYWHKIAKSESNIDCFRGEVVTRSPRDIHAFLQGLKQVFSEISQKVAAYRKGMDEDMLFPRNTYYCMSYGKPCEFASICRDKLRKNMLPLGFEQDRRKLQLGGEIEDQITES